MKPRALSMLNICFTTELHPQQTVLKKAPSLTLNFVQSRDHATTCLGDLEITLLVEDPLLRFINKVGNLYCPLREEVASSFFNGCGVCTPSIHWLFKKLFAVLGMKSQGLMYPK